MDIKIKVAQLQNHLQSENYKFVLDECNKLIKKYPYNPFFYNLCGLALQKNNNVQSAIKYFNKAIDLDQNNIAAINNLANSYKAMSKLDIAETLYLKALKINPKYVHALTNYGNLKQHIGKFEDSIELYLKAIEINPNQVNILLSLASAYQEAGNFEKSKEIANKILIIEPKNMSVHKLLSSIINYKNENKHLTIMENLIKDKNLKKEQLIDLSFALGKAYEDIGNYEKSFENLEMGNKSKKEKINYQIDNDVKLFKSITKVFEDIDLKGFNKISNNKCIIFICGMPRSGTTLVEQIIAAHPEVKGAGELVYLQNLIKQNFVENQKLNKQKIIDAALTNINIIEKEYFELLDFHKFTSNIITDKAPQNFRWLGFIKIFFPNSKIIHCNRNAKDNCLSLYKNNFASAHMDWTYDQQDIAEYYNLYFELMKFWNKKIPNDIYNANYEKIVQNKEIEIKKLIQFCGLKWDPACLNHHKHIKTPISTVSVVQARKPIYSSSLNSYNRYSKYLNSLYNSLKIE
tara:strand:- start:4805 stop:6358 length:1554 start_codon:yes stop_codon:yes gene_type:complete